MYKLDATGFNPLKMMAVANAFALLLAVDKHLRSDPAKITPYILLENKVQTVVTLALIILAFF
jgi:hypothetical protein